MRTAVAIMFVASALGLLAGHAMGIPWFGDVTSMDAPDPMVWWIPTSFVAYAWAVWLGTGIAGLINSRKDDE